MYGYNQENGIIYNNQERLDEIDKRIFERNIPTKDLERVFDPRPSHTRRTIFPIIDKQSFNVLSDNKVYNQRTQFNPGTTAPYSGYATFVDEENKLKNLFSPLQKGGIQGKYVPSSNSDMYKVNVSTTVPVEQSHNLLFESYNNFDTFNPNIHKLGYEVFNNHTRQQRRNVSIEEMKENEKKNELGRMN
jgi:hypothetical protein